MYTLSVRWRERVRVGLRLLLCVLVLVPLSVALVVCRFSSEPVVVCFVGRLSLAGCAPDGLLDLVLLDGCVSDALLD